jgi:hypothetical protein
MELRARIRPYARRTVLMAAFGALLAPATAGAATADAAARKARKYPVVTSVRPLDAAVGDTLTIRGRNFKRGRNKNSVLFKRDGGRAIFVKADVGTSKLLKVKVPQRLTAALLVQNGAPVATRFRIRVLADRLSKKFTRASLSPTIGPERPPAPPEPPQADPNGDCDGDGVLNSVDTDDDNDLLSDDTERSLKLDGCKPDTDGDGVEDGYEYHSALDWNDDEHQQPNAVLPYPAKMPYPNPLDAEDANIDHDGDSLTLKEEYDLWIYTVHNEGAPRDLNALAYSDGEQYTRSARGADGHRVPTLGAAGYDKQVDFLNWAGAAGYRNVMLAAPGQNWYTSRTAFDIRDFNRSGAVEATPNGFARAAEATYYDTNNDGWLSDEERDEDADGLTNFMETRGCMLRSYWDKLYDKETPYYLSYSGTRLDDGDSDGDGVRDGADDQDHDDLPNMMECSRQMANPQPGDARPALADPPAGRLSPPQDRGFLNPYNPCLPSPTSRSCNQHPSLDKPWAPFSAQDKYYYIWN